MTVYARPGSADALMTFESRYDNYIGGGWVAPAAGRYFENRTPITGEVFCEVARSDEADIEKALDAAHAAAPAWGRTTAAERAVILNKIADRIEENLEAIALDLGTTSIKAALLDSQGRLCHLITQPALPMDHQHGRYESNALDYVTVAEDVLRQCTASLNIKPVLGLSCQRSSFLVWERSSGQPVTPLISWQDDRGADVVTPLLCRGGQRRGRPARRRGQRVPGRNAKARDVELCQRRRLLHQLEVGRLVLLRQHAFDPSPEREMLLD